MSLMSTAVREGDVKQQLEPPQQTCEGVKKKAEDMEEGEVSDSSSDGTTTSVSDHTYIRVLSTGHWWLHLTVCAQPNCDLTKK